MARVQKTKRSFRASGYARMPRYHTFTGGLEHNDIVRNRLVSRYKNRIDLFGDANIAVETKNHRFVHVSVDKGLRKVNIQRGQVDYDRIEFAGY